MTEDDFKREREFIKHQADNVQLDWTSMFKDNLIQFNVYGKPPSLQNKQEKKLEYGKIIHAFTKKCPYIITSTCWIHIDYLCPETRRLKNPTIYDMDNIIKPILDALVGKDGLVIDDVIFDRVEVNWIDKNGLDEIQITIEYPNLLYHEKDSLAFYKNGSWCFPCTKGNKIEQPLIEKYFSIWNQINDENFEQLVYQLPQHIFIPYNKISDKGFDFYEI